MTSLWPVSTWRAVAADGHATPAEELTIARDLSGTAASAAPNEVRGFAWRRSEGRFYISPQGDNDPIGV